MTRSQRTEEISIWDRAEDEENRRRARVFEQEWHRSNGLGGHRPVLTDYLPASGVDRAAALLALIRVDMACRSDCGDHVRVEDYLALEEPSLHIPELVAAIAFEEYMIRLDAGENPRPGDYESRFPQAGGHLRDLFLIQEAFAGVESGTDDTSRTGTWEGFPAIGERIEGFQLVEELGTGSFSRVFLAHDVNLAGRLVALKVSRDKCAEWLTLARLQHTNIVPIHSHTRTQIGERTFDLVCMPYFGRVTLDSVIEQNQWSLCLNGEDIRNLLDGLQCESLLDESKDSSSRRHLASLSFDQAVAWWGSILAEALRHAHERHVLHRDIKPTNILITPGCEPMLLDFNLSHQTSSAPGAVRSDVPGGQAGIEPKNIGGTLAYMAPEHIEAMLTGQTRLVDQRADIYALGAVLYEVLTRRSGANKSNVTTGSREELLRQTLELRKIPVPPLRDIAPDVMPVLENVIRKCLDPDPARRYVSAAQLSEDLRAIASDRPVRYAHEPISCRVRRAVRHNARPVASAAAFVGLMAAGPGYHFYDVYRDEFLKSEKQRIERLARDASDDQRDAIEARFRNDFPSALDKISRNVSRLHSEPQLQGLLESSLKEAKTTQDMEAAFVESERFLARAGWLRYRVLHATRFGGELDMTDLRGDLERLLKPVLDEFTKFRADRENRTRESWLSRLNAERLEQVREWTDLILFETVCALAIPDHQADIRLGLTYCHDVVTVSEPDLPWTALRERLSAILEQRPLPAVRFTDPRDEKNPMTCLKYARLAELDGHPGESIKWASRCAALRPADPWVHHELALIMSHHGQYLASLDRLEIAFSLDPGSPWAKLDRARQCRSQGLYSQAWDDLVALRERFQGQAIAAEVEPLLALESGLVEQGLGRNAESMKWFRKAIDAPGVDRSIRLLAAQSLCEGIIDDRRFVELEPLLSQFDPDHDTRSSWAMVRARHMQEMERHQEALDTLDAFLQANPGVIRARVLRVQSLIKLGRPLDAIEECQVIVRRASTPTHRRLLDRCRVEVLAQLPQEDPRWLQTLLSLQVHDPDSVRLWPSFETETIRKVIRKIHALTDDPRMDEKLTGNLANRCLLTLAVLESALCEACSFETLDRTLTDLDPSLLTIRTQVLVLLNENRLDKAEELLEAGFRISFEDPLLVELRARLNFLRGDYARALEDFDNLVVNRDIPDVRAWRAKTLTRIGRWNESLSDVSKALAYDPFQPDWRVTRASIWHRLGRPDLARVDLDIAGQSHGDNGNLKLRIAMVRGQLELGELDKLDKPDTNSRNILKNVRNAFADFLMNVPDDKPKLDSSVIPVKSESMP